jgi:hypothetical protein
MPTRPQIEITREELDSAEIPMNHVLVEMIHTSEGATTKGGIIIGFNSETVYAEGDDSHSANLAEFYGRVYRTPHRLFFDRNDPKSMDWETEMELQEDDICFMSLIETKNAVEVKCEGKLYRSIPYQDIYAYKREIWVNKWSDPQVKKTVRHPINGYVLCKQVCLDKTSHLDAFSDTKVDKTKGIVAYVSEPVKTYLREEYCHIDNIQVGDLVLFDPKSPNFFLERTRALATFDGDEMYLVVNRRRIIAILNR